ncbi:MAG: serine hydrolase [bacterium]|nr:serine hydrolase [bacterium]
MVPPHGSEPGTKWLYNDGLSVILADIVSRVSGVRADIFAKENLLDPLGISADTFWVVNEYDEIGGGWGLFILPGDMIKFGKLFLQNGNWNGTQLISNEWVEKTWEVLDQTPSQGSAKSYGHHWWISDYAGIGSNYKALAAKGAGGQRIIIVPDLDMVVVLTMGDYDGESSGPEEQMQNHIIPAATGGLMPMHSFAEQ